MNSRVLSAVLAMLFLAAGLASAQTSPQATHVPWHNYVPARIDNNFQTIIGNGGTLLSNTNNRIYYNYYAQSFPLPFDFYFMDNTYSAGYNLRISTNGYIGFDGSSYYYSTYPAYLYPTTSTTYSYYSKVLMVWWGEVGTDCSNGGIYTKVEGSAPSRVLIVEFRMKEDYPGGGDPGNVQAKLYEGTGNIEIHFSDGSMGMTRPSTNPMYTIGYGAMVGIKNYGQNSGNPATGGDQNDANKYLIMLNPETNPDTVAITRLPTINYFGSTPYYPVYYAYFPSYNGTTYTYYLGSDVFHYAFPTENGQQIAYRMSPVLDDIATDSVWFTPTATADAYGVNATVTINAKFKNMGGHNRQNVPVQADVYYNGQTLVASRTTTAFPYLTPQFGTDNESFSSVGPLTQTGLYQVRVYPKLTSPIDQDFTNDTLYKNFYITKPNDLTPYAILQPFSNVAPLFTKYPVGVAVPLEVRYLNIGTNTQYNATVGYQVLDANGTVLNAGTTTISGAWGPISFRDVTFTGWAPTTPGRYYFRAITYLPTDENPFNDTVPSPPAIGKPFDVLYEIEVSANDPNLSPPLPVVHQTYPDGKPIPVRATFTNSGVSDATNVPATLKITDPAGNVVYNETVLISDIVGDGGQAPGEFPAFTPSSGPGQYCVTTYATSPSDPVRNNDTARWCFNVAPRLAGTIRVGYGERFATIKEARDSLFYYGVSGPLTFELVNDDYTVETNEATTPALDFRGKVVGLSSSNPVVWKPAAGKTSVTVNLKSKSGFGMWYGQDVQGVDPSGYVTWDGGPNTVLHFTYENTNTDALSNAYNRSIPFFFGHGASNYTLKNVTIDPVAGSERKDAMSLNLPDFSVQTLSFSYMNDLDIRTSAGVMLRNAAPIDESTGQNTNHIDTLRNQNNVIEHTQIRDFAYGIASVGAGPLFVVGPGRFAEYNNQNNRYADNEISNVSRGGIVMAYEQNSTIEHNRIENVENTSSTANAAGIWATAGTNNRGYSRDLMIDRNWITSVSSDQGTGAGIWIETAENALTTPNNVVQRYPAGLATNMTIWNNGVASFRGGSASAGIVLSPAAGSRQDLELVGNSVENNTLYNQIAGTYFEVGVGMVQNEGTIRNNVIALVSQPTIPNTMPMGVFLRNVSEEDALTVDYNLYWVPYGAVGSLGRTSAAGYQLPSPPVAMTLNQWRALTPYDMHSISGDVTNDFVNVTPGQWDLHMQATRPGTLANNRGVVISSMSQDIDGDSRGASAVAGHYDIGFDEYTGAVRNNDLMAEDVIAPAGYRAPTGQFSDAEYVMSDATVELAARVRNVGGMPNLATSADLIVERQNPQTGSYTQVSRQTVTIHADVASTESIDYGSFQPQTLRELNQSDSYYGSDPNVTPIYRFRLVTGRDDYAGNNTYEKQVRFYVQRSTRKILASVEDYGSTASDAVSLSNRLNADTLVAAFADINWDRADGSGQEDYDLFDRTMWPTQNLDFSAWKTMVWSQGEESEGLKPTERMALEQFLEEGTQYEKRSLVMASQELARIHDVTLTGSNGQVADAPFVETYLRMQNAGSTNPADYSNGKIRGMTINPGRYEVLLPTGVAGDTPPMPSVLRATTGQGIATPSHVYVDQTGTVTDTVAGVAAAGSRYNTVSYGFDWRHAGRFSFEPTRSGAQRLLLGALDFIDQFGGVLPIEWTSFEGYQVGRNAEVELEMTSATETNVRQIEVERADVQEGSTGEEIGSYGVVERLSPKGSATRGSSYSVRDRGVEYGRTYAYRLVTVDADGVRTVDRETRVTVSGAVTGAATLTVEPNPVVERGVIRYAVSAGDAARVSIYDAAGRLVKQAENRAGGEGTVEVAGGELPSGTYMVRLETTSGVARSAKLVIAK